MPGELFRGLKAQSAMAYDGKTARLSRSLYVLLSTLRLDPVPDARQPSPLRPAPSDVVELSPRSSADRVAALVRLWSTGSQDDRGQAQVELTRLWRELGDPGPGALQRLCEGFDSPSAGPPATAEGWQAWWQRVRWQRERPRSFDS